MTNIIEKVSCSAFSQRTEIGLLIRQRRKSFKVTANAMSEASGISRVTLHGIEKDELSVSIGACSSVLSVLDLNLSVAVKEYAGTKVAIDRAGWLPAFI